MDTSGLIILLLTAAAGFAAGFVVAITEVCSLLGKKGVINLKNYKIILIKGDENNE